MMMMRIPQTLIIIEEATESQRKLGYISRSLNLHHAAPAFPPFLLPLDREVTNLCHVIFPNVDQSPCTAVLAQLGDQDLRLLIEPF